MNLENQNSTLNWERISTYDNYSRKGELLSMIRFLICVVIIDIMAVARIWMWVSVFYCNVFIFVCIISALMWMEVVGQRSETNQFEVGTVFAINAV